MRVVETRRRSVKRNTCVNAAITGDINWLTQMSPFLELSAKYVLSFYDTQMQMLFVPGPLWIDVLVRENYTSDSNAIAPYLFRQLSASFSVLQLFPDLATQLLATADSIVAGMNKHLWDTQTDDHFVTQLNPAGGVRDFVDYDSNLLAAAFGVADDDRTQKLIARIDSGEVREGRTV